MSKYRLDFVTNSSSSSFVCCVCGGDESGWDLSLYEAEMYECTNGHVFHEDCANREILRKVLEEAEEKEDFDEYDFRYEASPEVCPICRFDKFLTKDLLGFIVKSKNLDLKEIKNNIRAEFPDYKTFEKYLK